MFECIRTQIHFTLDTVLCLCLHEDKNKKKKGLSSLQNLFLFVVRVDPMPFFAKGGFKGCGENPNSPRFLFFFVTRKRTFPCLEREIEKHKWSFSARLAVTSSWSFWSSAIHVALVKARRKTRRRLRWHVAPRVAAVCIPVVPAATNARIARTNEATAFVVAVGHIIIN